MATATLNGAVESGVSAGTDVANSILGSSSSTATEDEKQLAPVAQNNLLIYDNVEDDSI